VKLEDWNWIKTKGKKWIEIREKRQKLGQSHELSSFYSHEHPQVTHSFLFLSMMIMIIMMMMMMIMKVEWKTQRQFKLNSTQNVCEKFFYFFSKKKRISFLTLISWSTSMKHFLNSQDAKIKYRNFFSHFLFFLCSFLFWVKRRMWSEKKWKVFHSFSTLFMKINVKIVKFLRNLSRTNFQLLFLQFLLCYIFLASHR
jgi:hypothetical protein